MLRWFVIAILLVVSVSASATVVRFTVPKEGDYLYWFEVTDSDGSVRSTPPLPYSGKSAELDISSVSSDPQRVKLDVLNMETGDLHVFRIKGGANAKGATITHKVSEFTDAWLVVLNVVNSKGRPVKSALVKLTDASNKDHSVVVTPQDRGRAIFREIGAGQVRVDVEGPGIMSVVEPDFEIPVGRGLAPIVQEVKVQGGVETVEPASSDTGDSDGEPARKGSGQSLPVTIMQNLLGVVLLAAIIVVVYLLLKNRGVTVAETLKKAGVTLPQEEPAQVAAVPAPEEPAVDPNICPFCGTKKDANGNCACTLGGAPAASQPAAVPGKPRLVGKTGVYAGYVFDVTAGATIGREPSNAIALPNDNAVSRQHASIAMEMNTITLTDLGSSNGTFVNGAKIAVPTPVGPGDEVQIGQTRFRLEA